MLICKRLGEKTFLALMKSGNLLARYWWLDYDIIFRHESAVFVIMHGLWLQEEAVKALMKYGVGSCGPRGFYGTMGKFVVFSCLAGEMRCCLLLLIFQIHFSALKKCKKKISSFQSLD